MFCPFCGKKFEKRLDFYNHMIYNEGYNESITNRMFALGLLDEVDVEELNNMLEKINGK